MRKSFRPILGIALSFVACAAIAQVALPYVSSMNDTDAMQVITRGAPSAQSRYATITQLRSMIFGGNSELGTDAPTLSSCGSGSPSVSGTNFAGTVTTGTSATGCVITFATAYAAAPYCVVTSRVAPATSTPAYSVSATAITLVQASQSGNKWDYICVAREGG